eukprot:SAG11_NODE_592_length_8310_cov_3.191868_4_plen_228_part_00
MALVSPAADLAHVARAPAVVEVGRLDSDAADTAAAAADDDEDDDLIGSLLRQAEAEGLMGTPGKSLVVVDSASQQHTLHPATPPLDAVVKDMATTAAVTVSVAAAEAEAAHAEVAAEVAEVAQLLAVGGAGAMELLRRVLQHAWRRCAVEPNDPIPASLRLQLKAQLVETQEELGLAAAEQRSALAPKVRRGRMARKVDVGWLDSQSQILVICFHDQGVYRCMQSRR